MTGALLDTPGTGLVGILVLLALLLLGGRIGAVLGVVGIGGPPLHLDLTVHA